MKGKFLLLATEYNVARILNVPKMVKDVSEAVLMTFIWLLKRRI